MTPLSSRWLNVYPDHTGTLLHTTRADADAAAGPNPRSYVLRYDLDDEDDRDIVTRETA